MPKPEQTESQRVINLQASAEALGHVAFIVHPPVLGEKARPLRTPVPGAAQPIVGLMDDGSQFFAFPKNSLFPVGSSSDRKYLVKEKEFRRAKHLGEEVARKIGARVQLKYKRVLEPLDPQIQQFLESTPSAYPKSELPPEY